MRVTALGVCATYPKAGGACTGWLLQEGATQLLVDCGTGVLASLQRHLPFYQVSDVIITHFHADHFLDLVPLRYALKYGPYAAKGPPPRLLLPPGGETTLTTLASLFENPETFFSEAFGIQEYDPGSKLVLGDLQVSFAPADHYIPTYAVAVADTHRVVFSADSGPSEGLVRLAQGADLFICEATWLKPEESHMGVRGHMTAWEAGELAHKAGVKRLLLTHILPHLDAEESLRQAAKAFGGPVELAQEGQSYVP